MAEITVQGSIYDKVVFKSFSPLKSQDLNDLQDNQNFFHEESNKYSVGDGPDGESWKIRVDDKNSATLIIQHGSFVHKGKILHLPQDVSYDYTSEKTTLSPTLRYVFYCMWEDVTVDASTNPQLNDPRLGETSTRTGQSFVFGIHPEFSEVPLSSNYIPLAVLVFKGSNGNLIDLTQGDIQDLRLNVAQHYVVDGFNFKSSSIVGSDLQIILDGGGLSYLGIFKRLNSVTDISDLTFTIPLPAVGTQSRYRISYRLDSIITDNPVVLKVISPVLNSTTVQGSVVDLFNFTVDSAGIVPETLHDIRQYEPLSRRIPSNARPALADLVFLKPRQSASPGMVVEVEKGWYFYRGEYKFSPHQTKIHDALPSREISSFDLPNTPLSGSGSYFTFSTASIDYYVWYEVDNPLPATNDPSLAGSTGIRVDVSASDTAEDMALKTQLAMSGNASFSVSYSSNTVTIVNSIAGDVTDLADFNAGITNISISNGNQHRKDVVGFDSNNVLQLFKGEEVVNSITPPEPSGLTSDIFQIYDVIIDSTTERLTDAADLSSIQNGEIRDLRNILHHLMPAEKVNVDSSGFSGTASGGLGSTPSDRNLQDVTQEINDQLVSVSDTVGNLGLIPQDDPAVKVGFSAGGDLTIGHENYDGANTNLSTKVGIGVNYDPTNPNKVIIKNTWDEQLRTLAGGGLVPDTMHYHAGDGGLENGSPISVTRPLVEDRPWDRFALVSDFILSEVSVPTFKMEPATNNVPTHIVLNLNPNGGIKVDDDGVSLLIDSARGLTGNTSGIGVNLDSILSGLEFQDDGSGTFFLKVKDGLGLTINSNGELELALDPTGGVVVSNGTIKIGKPSDFIDATRGLTGIGSSPNELLGLSVDNPFQFNGSGQLSLRISDLGGVKPSYLKLENTTSGTAHFLSLDIDEGSGLQQNSGSLAVHLNQGLQFDGLGAINIKSTNSFSFSNNKELQFNADTLVDSQQGLSENAGLLGLKVDSESSLTVDATAGAQVLVTDPLEHSGTGPSNIGLKLQSSNPSLEVKTLDNNSLGVRLDPDGNLESSSNGVKVKSFVSLGETAVYIYGGVVSFPFSTIGNTPAISYDEKVMNGFLTKYDYNFKNTTFMGAHTDADSLVHSHGSFVVSDGSEDLLNIVGGSTNVSLNATLSHRIFNFTTEAWSSGSTIGLGAMNEVASVKIDVDEGAVLAGSDSLNPGTMSIYKSSAPTGWSNLNLPEITGDLDGASACLYDTNKILLAGGNNGLYQTTIYSIELAGVGGSRSIASMSPLLISLPEAKSHMATFSLNSNEVYFVGGETGVGTHSGVISKVEGLDTTPTIDHTRFLPVFGKSRLAGDVINNEAVLVGGLTLNDAYTNDVMVYNPTLETFRIDSKLLTGIRNHTVNVR